MKFNIKKINPITKILSAAILSVVQTFSKSLCSRTVLLLISLSAFFLTKSKFKLKFKSIVTFLVFSYILSLFFSTPSENDILFKAGFININISRNIRNILETFASMSLNAFTFWITSMTLLNSIAANEIPYIINLFIKPFEKFKHLNVNVSEISTIVSLAIRFVPVIVDESRKIMIAQEARGASISRGSIFKRIKYIVPIFDPIFASCFRRAINVSIAMESRCYGAPFERTYLYQNKFRKIDIFIVLGTLLIGFGVIWCNSVKIF